MLLQVLTMMGRVLVETFTSPLFVSIYLGLFLLVAWQYRRLYRISEDLFDYKSSVYLRSALASALFGLVGCLVGSLLLVLLGIDLANIGIGELWLVAVLLMFIHPRFLCFAYASGVLAVMNLLFGYPQLSIVQLMGLVAILHMVESLLILLNGHLSPVPVYVKSQDMIRGGFNLQKFWPLPLVAMVSVQAIYGSGGLNMPDWWPLLKDYAQFTADQTYSLLPVMAMLGYGEITTTRTPAARVRKSAWHLFLFSLSLLILTIMASRWAALTWVIALFGPVGHELVIWLGMREETNRQPIYTNPPSGVMILDVVPGTPAFRAGLASRDIILEVNGEQVYSYFNLEQLLHYGSGASHMKVFRGGKFLYITCYNRGNEKVGIIPVPDGYTGRYLETNQDGIFAIARKLWKRIKFW
ncbi:MAG: PDZ domain-containing protein [Syntrophomonadaceae bacterium]